MSQYVCRPVDGARRLAAVLCLASLGGAGISSPARAADVGAGLRMGTLGIGADIDVAFNEYLGARVGYSAFSLDRSVDQTAVTYDANFKLSSPSATLDWYMRADGFRISVGAVASGTRIAATGRPSSAATFTLNGTQYSAAQLTSLTGEFKFGNSVAPYLGVGWGNPARTDGHWSFLFDLGVIYGGTPKVTLNAACSASAPATLCAQLATDVAAEKLSLQSDLTVIKWYPVISFGAGYRF